MYQPEKLNTIVLDYLELHDGARVTAELWNNLNKIYVQQNNAIINVLNSTTDEMMRLNEQYARVGIYYGSGDAPDWAHLQIDPDADIDDALFKQLGQAVENGGIIFNDFENNDAPGKHAIATGSSTIAGGYAFIIRSSNASEKRFTLDTVEGLSVGDVYSCYMYRLKVHYDLAGKIVAIDPATNSITVDTVPFSGELVDESGEYWSLLWVPTKPHIGTVRTGEGAFCAGINNIAFLNGAFAVGADNLSAANYSFTAGKANIAAYAAAALGESVRALGIRSFATGHNSEASGYISTAEGYNTLASGTCSHAQNDSTKATASYSTAMGWYSEASGEVSTALGFKTIASGKYSIAFGNQSKAYGESSFATGILAAAEGKAAATFGYNTRAKGEYSFAAGYETSAENGGAFATGSMNTASGNNSFVAGQKNNATGYCQSVFGRFNAEKSTLFSVGVGTAENDRRNGFDVFHDGHAEVLVQGIQGNAVVQRKYLDGIVGDIESALDAILTIQENLIAGGATV